MNALQMTDEQRATRRKQLQASIAETNTCRKKISELQGAIEQLEETIDAAVERHAAACQPIQAKLAALDANRANRIADGNDDDDADDSQRRKELITELTNANVTLETVTTTNRGTIAALKTKIKDLSRKCVPSVEAIENDIVRCSPMNEQAKYHAFNQQQKFASQWCDDAGKRAVTLKEIIQTAGSRGEDAAGARQRLAFAEAEMSLAGEWQLTSRKQADDLRRMMIED